MGNNSSNSSKTDNGSKQKNNKKPKKINQKEINKIIQRLYDFEDLLQKKIAFIESQTDKEIKNAKKHGKKNKRAALGALRRKRNLEMKIERLEGTLSQIELQREALENANTNAEILRVMKQANTAMNKAHSNLDVDSIHRLMDDVAEQQEFSREVNDAVANPVGFNQEFDEDELMRELDNLIEEEQQQDDRKYKKRPQPALAARQPSQVSQFSQFSQASNMSDLPDVPQYDPQFPQGSNIYGLSDLPDVPQDDFEKPGRHTLHQRRREAEVLRQLEKWAAS